jgi:DNA helicase II / ATP-dependent DNA helicase PcrA
MTDPVVVPSIAVDPDQKAVIETPVSSRLSVTAGPGTGKTRTLLARAQWLVDHEELEPGTELLVLSFSRAAVETVARRGFTETDLGRLPVRTIDSLAGRLLLEADVSLEDSTYDGRVAAATKALTENRRAGALLSATRHVLVDEAQDVVGVRAVFVKQLLELVCRDSACGFTVFGDPAQAIFDFQTGQTGGDRRRLLDLLGPLAQERRELATNHRMRTSRLVGFADSVGATLRTGGKVTDWPAFHDEVFENVLRDTAWADLDDSTEAIGSALEMPAVSSVAVLCRTNAEVLCLAAHLQRAGLDVAVRHRAQDRGGAPWLATLFSDAPVGFAPIPPNPDRSSDRPWMRPPPDLVRILRQVGLARDRDIDLGRLATLLRCGACPEELIARRDAAVTVSTVHRAKGLEYDTVFVVETTFPLRDEDAQEKARVLYVAGTRAREELLAGAPLSFDGPIRGLDRGARTCVCSWAKPKRPVSVEVKISDSDPDWSPSDPDEFRQVQAFLREGLVPGEALELGLISDAESAKPRYEIVHGDSTGEETVVGRTTSQFGVSLKRSVWGRAPDRITGLLAEIPDTAAMTAVAADRVGLADHGVHLRARAYGLGRMWWN